MRFDQPSANEEIAALEEQLAVVRAQMALAKAGLNLSQTTEWKIVREAIGDCLIRKGKRLLALARQQKLDADRIYRLQGEIAGIEEFASVCDVEDSRLPGLEAEEQRLTADLLQLRTSLSQTHSGS